MGRERAAADVFLSPSPCITHRQVLPWDGAGKEGWESGGISYASVDLGNEACFENDETQVRDD